MLMFSHVQAFNENEKPQEHKNYTPWGFKILHQKLNFAPTLVPQELSSSESLSAVRTDTSP